MPTAISHGLVAFVIGKIFTQSRSTKFWVLSIICSVLPDIDIIIVSLGIPLHHVFGHRGISHSILFVLLTALIVVFIWFRETKRYSKEWWILTGYFFFLGLSHIILDAMTSGGQGIGFFMPFDSTRYLFPFRPIRASPLRIMRFFGSEGQRILISEMFWIWIPVALALIIIRFVRLSRNKN